MCGFSDGKDARVCTCGFSGSDVNTIQELWLCGTVMYIMRRPNIVLGD